MLNAENVLQRPTLVLNRRWTPIRTAPVQDAIGLVARGHAMIIEPESFETHDLASWNDVSRARAQAGLQMTETPKKPSWKSLVQAPTRDRRESWDKFLSRAYWEVELEP